MNTRDACLPDLPFGALPGHFRGILPPRAAGRGKQCPVWNKINVHASLIDLDASVRSPARVDRSVWNHLQSMFELGQENIVMESYA